MNNTQRTHAIFHYESFDRLPVVHFGYWPETLQKWIKEGHLAKDENGQFNALVAGETASAKLGFDFGWVDYVFPANCFLEPAFERKVIKTFPDGSAHVRNADGTTVLQVPDIRSIPAEIDHLLKDRASWEEHYKPRLQWTDTRKAWWEHFAKPQNKDSPRGLPCGSLLGIIRNVVGVEGLAYLIADDEELFDEIIQTVGDLCHRVVQEVVAAGIHIDYAQFWEDVCFKNGPMINPAMFDEKFGPYYKKITDELKKGGVDIVSVDCDGCIDTLIPTWVHNGVNTMFPMEVGTWNGNIRPWREKYGKEIRGVGGMKKSVFAQDRKAIDAEIERLKPLVALGGYIPCPDHYIPPDAKWDMVRYYCDQMHATFS